jgi:hypothetical protein
MACYSEHGNMEVEHGNDWNQGLQNGKRYSLLKSERLNAKIKLTIHKASIRIIMTHDHPAWDFAADKNLIKLSRP